MRVVAGGNVLEYTVNANIVIIKHQRIMSKNTELKVDLNKCFASPPQKGVIETVDENGFILEREEVGGWSEYCPYCGKKWREHD